MRDELPDWMDAPTEDAEPPRRRLHRLLALAAVPWVLVAVLVGWHGSGAATDAPPPSGEPASPDPAAAGEPSPAASPSPGTTGADGDVAAPPASDEPSSDPAPDDPVAAAWRGGWREQPGDGASVAVAVAVARAWLTGLGPSLELDGIPAATAGSYAEHLTVEAIERPGPGAAVVTLAAVVLDSGEPPAARWRRLAVPIDESAIDPRPAGPPWELPPLALEPNPPVATEELQPELWPAAEAALRTAGFTDAELRGLQRTTSWPVLATVRTQEPDGPRDQIVWLRRHLEGFVVAGLPLSQALPRQEESR